jgi:hypothetical protein
VSRAEGTSGPCALGGVPTHPDERRIQVFVKIFGEIRMMDIRPDILHAVFEDDPSEAERTAVPATVDRGA